MATRQESTSPDPTGDEFDDEGVEMRKVTISMPASMHDELRRRARRKGISVTELMRRGVVIEKVLFDDPENEILVKHGDEIQRVIPIY